MMRRSRRYGASPSLELWLLLILLLSFSARAVLYLLWSTPADVPRLVESAKKSTRRLGRSSRDAASEQARQKAADLRDAGARQVHNAQYRAEEMGQQAADQVRNQPAAAVGLAVGLGFLLGFMTGRK